MAAPLRLAPEGQDFLNIVSSETASKAIQKSHDAVVHYSQRVQKVKRSGEMKGSLVDLVITEKNLHFLRLDGRPKWKVDILEIRAIETDGRSDEFTLRAGSSRKILRSSFRVEITNVLKDIYRKRSEGKATLPIITLGERSKSSASASSDAAGKKDNEGDASAGESVDVDSPKLSRRRAAALTTAGVRSEEDGEGEETDGTPDAAADLQFDKEIQSSGDGFLLTNVVDGDFVTGTLRTVLERKKRISFGLLLDRFVDRQERMIRSLCSQHFEEFLASVAELKAVREDIRDLADSAGHLNAEVQEWGKRRVEAGENLQRARYAAQNLGLARDCILRCKALADLSARVDAQIAERRFYPALKTLDAMEHRVNSSRVFVYGAFLRMRIPKAREKIKRTVMADVNEWLVRIRSDALTVGRYVSSVTKKALEREHTMLLSGIFLFIHSVSQMPNQRQRVRERERGILSKRGCLTVFFPSPLLQSGI